MSSNIAGDNGDNGDNVDFWNIYLFSVRIKFTFIVFEFADKYINGMQMDYEEFKKEVDQAVEYVSGKQVVHA